MDDDFQFELPNWIIQDNWTTAFILQTLQLQSGALSLVGIVEIVLSLVQSFTELKYFHSVATPALLYHKDTAQDTQWPLLRAFLAFHRFFMA